MLNYVSHELNLELQVSKTNRRSNRNSVKHGFTKTAVKCYPPSALLGLHRSLTVIQGVTSDVNANSAGYLIATHSSEVTADTSSNEKIH